MVRNIDHRVEAACPVLDQQIADEIRDIIQIQLSDNVKARILNNEQTNQYVNPKHQKVRSQIETYQYLHRKAVPSNRQQSVIDPLPGIQDKCQTTH